MRQFCEVIVFLPHCFALAARRLCGIIDNLCLQACLRQTFQIGRSQALQHGDHSGDESLHL
jgi:hypothetical protein